MIDIRLFDIYLTLPSGHLLPDVDQLTQRAQGHLGNRTPQQVRDLVLMVDALVDLSDTDEESAVGRPASTEAEIAESNLSRLRRGIAQVDWKDAEGHPAPRQEELFAAFALANLVLAKGTLSAQARLEPEAWNMGNGFLPKAAVRYCLEATEALASADQIVHMQRAAAEIEQSHQQRRQTIASLGGRKRYEAWNRLKHDFYRYMKEQAGDGKANCRQLAEPFYLQWLAEHRQDAPDINADNIARTL